MMMNALMMCAFVYVCLYIIYLYIYICMMMNAFTTRAVPK